MIEVHKINALHGQIEELKEKLNENQAALKRIFTDRQINKLKNPAKRPTWSAKEISEAIALHSTGPRAYRHLLKKGYPFPAVSTLKSWVKKVKISPGILKNVFNVVNCVEMKPLEKICVLSFDEMKLRPAYCYDKVNDETLPPYNYVQVVMMRGLVGKWKQPIFFEYDCNMTKDKLFQIIKYVESEGFYVSSIVSDLGGSNRGLHRELEIDHNKPYFESPVNNHNIFVLAVVPHLLKLVRNNFIDYGLMFKGKEINKNTLEKVLNATQKSDLSITHKISMDNLLVSGPQRQKVKIAAKLFSHTVSQAIIRCGTLGLLDATDNWMECAEFIKMVKNFSLYYICMYICICIGCVKCFNKTFQYFTLATYTIN